MTMANKMRIVGEISCPGYAGGKIHVEKKADFCGLKATMDEALLKNGCTIKFSTEPDVPRPKQGSMFATKPPKGGQRSLFGAKPGEKILDKLPECNRG